MRQEEHIQMSAKTQAGKQPGTEQWQEISGGLLTGLGLTVSDLLLQAGIVQGLEAPGCTWCHRCSDAACSVTAGDAHGCTWRQGKAASVAPGRSLSYLTTVACADLEEHFSPNLSHAGLLSPQLTMSPSCGEQDTESRPYPGSRIVWAVALGHSKPGIGVPFRICPTQIHVDLPLPGPWRGIWGQMPPLPCSLPWCRRINSREEAADISTG